LILIKYFVGNFIAGFISIGARWGLEGRYGEACHAPMFDKPVGSRVQLVWEEGKKSLWKAEAGPGSDE